MPTLQQTGYLMFENIRFPFVVNFFYTICQNFIPIEIIELLNLLNYSCIETCVLRLNNSCKYLNLYLSSNN